MTPSCKLAPGTAALDYDSTLIGALELSSKKWVFAVQLPGSKKHTRQGVASFLRQASGKRRSRWSPVGARSAAGWRDRYGRF